MRKPIGMFSWLRGEWMLLAGLALIVVFSVGLTREVFRRRVVVRELAALQEDIRSLNARRDEIQGLIAEFQKTTTQEREARTRLNLAKPGEQALIIQRSEAAADPSAQTGDPAAAPQTEAPNPTKWWQYFFGL